MHLGLHERLAFLTLADGERHVRGRLRRVEQNWIFGHAAEVKRRSVHAALRHIRDTLKFNIIVVAVTRKDELMMIVDEAKEMGMWAG